MHLFDISGEFIGGLTSWGSRALSLPKKSKALNVPAKAPATLTRCPARRASGANNNLVETGPHVLIVGAKGVTGCVPEKLEARYVGALRHLA
jgi:hypothetical protein